MNIFRRWFATKTEQQTDDSQNPWAGLASYEDPETAERKLLFCGRDDESYDVAKLIMGNIFVTLYGKSGIGKTSLLNAGVFPELREEQYTPLSLRLGMRDETNPQRYQSMIVGAVERKASRFETIDVIDEQQDEQAADYLWNYFARHRFYDKNGEPTTPVLVFDQFEEVFRSDREETETLLRQLDYINDKDHALDNCTVEGHPYRYEQNFRFVVSIREDDLYRLEDSLDNCYLPALKRCRYRLRSLSEQGAHDAILKPGKGLFKAEEEKGFADRIIAKSKNEDGSISTNIVSLLCSRIFVDYQRSGAYHITPTLVDSFLKGNPFERFYNEATRGFSNREKSYIEDNLVDVNGRRNSIPESNFLSNVKNGAVLLEGERKILQRTSTSSDGGNYRVELIHDSFCEPLAVLKEKREKRRRVFWFSFVVAMALIFMGIVSLIVHQKLRNQTLEVTVSEKELQLQRTIEDLKKKNASLQKTTALLNNEKIASEKKSQQLAFALEAATSANHAKEQAIIALQLKNKELAEEQQRTRQAKWEALEFDALATAGNNMSLVNTDARASALIALEKLPSNVSDPDRPVTPEAEALLRESVASQNRLFDGVAITSFCGNERIVKAVPGFESSTANRIVLDVDKGLPVDTLPPSFIMQTNDSRYLIFGDKSHIVVQNAHSRDTVCNFPISGQIMDFTPDGKYLISKNKQQVFLWDVEEGLLSDTLTIEGNIKKVALSPDGKQLFTSSEDHVNIIWDIKKRKTVSVLQGLSKDIEVATFNPTRKQLFISTRNAAILWDSESGTPTDTLNTRNYIVSASFSPNGDFIVTSSYFNSAPVIIWETNGGNKKTSYYVDGSFVYNVQFSPDGKRVLVASVSSGYHYATRIWDVSRIYGEKSDIEGGISNSFFDINKNHVILYTKNNNIYISDMKNKSQSLFMGQPGCPHYSANGKIVAAFNEKYIRIWDAESHKWIKDIRGGSSDFQSISIAPTSDIIASASTDGTIRFWDILSGKELYKLHEKAGGIGSVQYSSNGNYIVSISDGIFRIWDVKTKNMIRSGNHDGHDPVVFSHDSKYVAYTHKDSIIIQKLMSGKTDRCITNLDLTNLLDLKFSPDGNHLLAGFGADPVLNNDSRQIIWNWKTGRKIKELKNYDTAAYSPKGDSLLLGSLNSSAILLLNTKNWERIDSFISGEGNLSVEFSPDARYVLSCNLRFQNNGYRQYISSFDSQKDRRLGKKWQKKIYARNFDYGCFSPDGKFVLLSDNNNYVGIWDFEKGKEQIVLDSVHFGTKEIAFSPDGKYLIILKSIEKKAMLWDVATGKSIRSFDFKQRDRVKGLSYSNNGKFIAVFGGEIVTIWDVETGDTIRSLIGHEGSIYNVSFSHNDKYIITSSGNGNAIIWNMETGEAIHKLTHGGSVKSAMFSKDGKYILTAGGQFVIVWDSKTGKIVKTYYSKYSDNAFWGPNDDEIISWGNNGVKIWDFPPLQLLINETRKRFKNRPLTPEERRKYYFE